MLHARSTQTVALLALVILGWLSALVVIGHAAGVLGGGARYDLPLWIGRNLTRAWLNRPARSLGGGFSPAPDNEVIDFFGRTSAVAAAETDLAYAEASRQPVGAAERTLRVRLDRARELNLPVQERLSTELSSVVAAEGLSTTAPLYDGLRLVWPPVSFAYDLPPLLLIRSPRDRIELSDATLLRNDLSRGDVQRLEAQAEAHGASALVVRVGGVATYPSIVEEDDGYAVGLELIAHEWTHHYLAFHPLGVRYFQSRGMTTINETVANMVGHELASAMRLQYPLAGTPARVAPSAPPPDPSVNFDRTMHQLRLDVDALLAQGRVDEADAQMDETRRFLVAHGYYVPRINQAYFAFYGTYADTAASTSPLGPQLATLRTRYGSLKAFVVAVQDVRSPGDLQRLLSASGG